MLYVLRHAHTAALVLVLSTLVGCQKDVANLPSPSSDGVESTSAYPSVVEIILSGGLGMCSGTFISKVAVLTAAHCINAFQGQGQYTVITSFGTFTTSNVQSYTNAPLTDAVDDPNDIAILYFDSPVADPTQGQVSAIGDKVSVGDTLRLVGFGCNNFDTHAGTGTKRTGTNVVYEIGDYIQFETPVIAQAIIGPDNRAGSCAGDSGGIAGEINADGSLTLVGVTHAGGYDSMGIESEYVDMTRADNRAFVASVNQQFNLGIAGF